MFSSNDLAFLNQTLQNRDTFERANQMYSTSYRTESFNSNDISDETNYRVVIQSNFQTVDIFHFCFSYEQYPVYVHLKNKQVSEQFDNIEDFEKELERIFQTTRFRKIVTGLLSVL